MDDSHLEENHEPLLGNKGDDEIEQKKGIPNWVKTGLAVAVSFLLLGFFFKDINWQEFIKATAEANLWLALLAIVFQQVGTWLFTVFWIGRSFTWFHKPFPLKEYMWVRGALYLIMIVNTGIGGAGNVLYLQQKTQISWLKFIAISFFRLSIHFAAVGVLLIISTISLHLLGIFDETPLNPWLWWAILLLGQLSFLDAWYFFVKGKRIGLIGLFVTDGEEEGRLIGGIRNRKHELWSVFHKANQKQWVLMWFWGLVSPVITIIGYWLFVKAFNIDIPIILFISTVLLVVVLQDAPIAFAGFGATTLAWSLFYGDYATPEALASMTLCMPLMRLLVRGSIGAVSMRPAMSDISKIIKDYKKGFNKNALSTDSEFSSSN